jgi:SAM-dependent methyltransferase
MGKKKEFDRPKGAKSEAAKSPWPKMTLPIAKRYDCEYLQKPFDLPEEVEAMPLFQDWASGKLQNQIASPFWELFKPKKDQKWLDIGCGISFLIYPWRDWNALFYGQEVSTAAHDILRSRGPQLNSKLFKNIHLGGAHEIPYEDQFFDGVVATGWSCYYGLEYGKQALAEMKRTLKPKGTLLLDVINPDSDLAEDWAILETYFGAEVMLTPLEDWDQLIREAGGKRVKTQTGRLFDLFLIRFS